MFKGQDGLGKAETMKTGPGLVLFGQLVKSLFLSCFIGANYYF